jgi:hypothetical protein
VQWKAICNYITAKIVALWTGSAHKQTNSKFAAWCASGYKPLPCSVNAKTFLHCLYLSPFVCCFAEVEKRESRFTVSNLHQPLFCTPPHLGNNLQFCTVGMWWWGEFSNGSLSFLLHSLCQIVLQQHNSHPPTPPHGNSVFSQCLW